MATILIKNGRIWDGGRFFFGDIAVENGRISQIADCIEEPAEFTYDASGQTVTPGLVDIHVHMHGTASDAFSIQAEMSSYPFGVTAVNDAGSVYGDKALLDTYHLKNTVFATADIKDNHICFDSLAERLAKYGSRALGIKIYFDTDDSSMWDITPVKEICRYAQEKGLQVMVHCANSPTTMWELVSTLNPGDILTHAYHGGKHSAAEDHYACHRLAKERGIIIDAGFAGHIHTDFEVFRGAVQQGLLPDTISTDITKRSAYKRGGKYGMTLCMSLARYMGMEESDIFRAVTSSAAKALGKEQEWGALKVGRTADIAVLQYADEGFDLTDKAGNHIFSTEGYRCNLTVVDGEILYRR